MRVAASLKTIPVITGPTGSGKTALAVAYARKHGAVIISADSRQIYRHMDIGTAKPYGDERDVPHYLIDIRNPDEGYSAGEFVRDAGTLMDRFDGEGRPYLIVGGSGFYIGALMHGGISGQPADDAVREGLRDRLDREGTEALRAQLVARDPRSAERIHPNDHYRLLRALEIIELTGAPVAAATAPSAAASGRRFRLAALKYERPALYGRINVRVDAMMVAGLEAEVRHLAALGFARGSAALKTVGYAEIFAYIDGECTLADAVDRIKMNTRRYAKRQLTWFRRHDVTWLDPVAAAHDPAGYLERFAEGVL